MDEVLSLYYYARAPIEFAELLIEDIVLNESKDPIKKALSKLQRIE